ncbi:MAG: hypothetical protein ABIZ56_01585 [Chthoniobacteraceae bacterium]
MTNTTLPDEVLKSDALGRVRTPRARREALLAEFAQSGVSAKKFSELVGVNYQTFASWVQARSKARGQLPAAGPLRLLEAVVEGGAGEAREPVGAPGLWIELPGGSRMSVASPVQLQMAAELVALLAQRTGARC